MKAHIASDGGISQPTARAARAPPPPPATPANRRGTEAIPSK